MLMEPCKELFPRNGVKKLCPNRQRVAFGKSGRPYHPKTRGRMGYAEVDIELARNRPAGANRALTHSLPFCGRRLRDGRTRGISTLLLNQGGLFVRIQAGENVEDLTSVCPGQEPELVSHDLVRTKMDEAGRLFEDGAGFTCRHCFQFGDVIVPCLPGQANGDLSQCADPIRVSPIVGGTDFASTDPIIDYLLLVPKITEVCPHHRTKLVIVKG